MIKRNPIRILKTRKESINMMKNPPEKYTIEELRVLPEDARLAKVGLMIANELHNICCALKKTG